MPEVIINGPEGRLECKYQPGREGKCAYCIDAASTPATWRDDEQ